MNQEKIGKFIANCRKEKNLSQEDLAEKLNFSNKTVSKWETGKSMPDASVMLELCKILDISANELLSGERIDKEKNKEQITEKNIVDIYSELNKIKKEEKIHRIISIITIILLICVICITGYFFLKTQDFINIVFGNYEFSMGVK